MTNELSQKIAVVATPDSDHERAQQFAIQHKLAFYIDSKLSPDVSSVPYVLHYQAGSIAILQTQKGAPGPVSASFVGGKTEHRRLYGGGKGQLIAKAVGLKAGIVPSVLDATAGLGRDAFVLASLGCKVHMLERSPVISELLSYALTAAQTSDIDDVVARMSLETTDAVHWLNQHEDKVADVIYLDPMYPVREKSSLVKKEMRVFKELVRGGARDSELLVAALNRARYRVVVKRPRKGVMIEGLAPSYQLNGKSSRYDIYALKGIDELRNNQSKPRQLQA